MADFAANAAAAMPAFGWHADDFFEAYAANRYTSSRAAVDASPIAPLIIDLASAGDGGGFEGTPTALWELLLNSAGEHTRHQQGWPKNAQGVSTQLTRLRPDLAQLGIDVDFSRTGSGRLITIRTASEESANSASSASQASLDAEAGRLGVRSPIPIGPRPDRTGARGRLNDAGDAHDASSETLDAGHGGEVAS